MMITSTERNLIVTTCKMRRIDLLPPAAIGSGRTTRVFNVESKTRNP